jgi:hypothetical protein
MATLEPRKPYTLQELEKLYPSELQLQLVQILLRHGCSIFTLPAQLTHILPGERSPVSPRFLNAGLRPCSFLPAHFQVNLLTTYHRLAVLQCRAPINFPCPLQPRHTTVGRDQMASAARDIRFRRRTYNCIRSWWRIRRRLPTRRTNRQGTGNHSRPWTTATASLHRSVGIHAQTHC